MRRTRLSLFAATLVAAAVFGVVPSAGASSAVKFPGWTGADVGRFTVAVAAADLNGDGRADLAWGRDDFFNDTITVQLTGLGGRLGAPQPYPAVAMVKDIAAGDLNGDGRRDLVAVAQGIDYANHAIDIYLNGGGGSFTHATVNGGAGPARVLLRDLNADAKLDLVLTNSGLGQGTTVGVMLGHGDGTFASEVRYTLGAGVYGVTAADLTGDGSPDLAVGRAPGDGTVYHVTVLRNDTHGAFTSGATLDIPTSDGFSPATPSVAAADFDGDARIDLAATAGGTGHLVVFRNLGNLNFTPTTYDAGFGATRLLATDVGADGRPDLIETAVGDTFAGNLVLLRNLGGGTFGPPGRIEAGPQPHGVAVADMTGDGRLDLIAANRGSGTGSIDPQMSNGTFAVPPLYDAVPQLLPLDSATADFDGDGHPDMALSQLDITSTGNDVVAIMHNDGTGHMGLTFTLPSGTSSHAKSVIAADLNRDGRPDLAWTPEIFIEPAYRLAVALNNGNGTFSGPALYPLETCGTGAVSAGDVNRDGKLDLIVANNRSGPSAFCDAIGRTVRVVLGNGDGTFQPDFGVQIGHEQEMAATGDVNRDGRSDIITTSATTDVVLGLPGGGFAAPVTYDARGNEFALVDFNADKRTDIVTADGSTSRVYVLLNNGTGSFSVHRYDGEQVPELMNGRALVVGDLDRDGLLDVAVSHEAGQNAGVFYGRPDGQLGPDIRYGTHPFFTDINLADYNGDGRLDLAGPGGIETQAIFPEHPGVSMLLQVGSPCLGLVVC